METKCDPWGWACTAQGREIKVTDIILGSKPQKGVGHSRLRRALGSIPARDDRSVFNLFSPDFSATSAPLFPQASPGPPRALVPPPGALAAGDAGSACSTGSSPLPWGAHPEP